MRKKKHSFSLSAETKAMLAKVAATNGLSMSAYLSARIHADYAAIMKKLPGQSDRKEG